MFSLDAEQSVLGALLLDNDAYDRMGPLEKGDFYRADHQAIFGEVKRLIEGGKGADVITIGTKLQASDVADLSYVHQLAANTPSTANIGHYASIVRGFAQRRALTVLAREVADLAENPKAKPISTVELAQAKLEAIADQRVGSEPTRVADDLVGYLEELERRSEGEGPKAIAFGFPDLDKKLMGGIRRGELAIVAARPKMGKSAFAFNVALHAARDHSVLILSMEMPRTQIHDRNVAVAGKIDLPKVIDPRRMQQPDWDRLTVAIKSLEKLNLSIDDQGGLRLMDVRLKARSVKRRHGLDLMIIDYLQLMDGEGDSRNAQIEGITRGLKALAKEMDIGIILLSQLNRNLEQRPNKRPMPSDLRDSGAIEQDCDMALFLYRDEVYNEQSRDRGICEVNVGLIRQGEPGTVGLSYHGAQTRFESLDHGRVFGLAHPQQKTSRALKD